MEYRELWYASNDPALAVELQCEVVPGHVLYGVPVHTLARRQDRDDVLFELQDGSGRLAKVHLTWQKEQSPSWPITTVFHNVEAWSEAMRADCAEYGA